MFYNVSNHPANSDKTTWSAEQKAVANQIAGKIVDIPIPQVTPDMPDQMIETIARGLAKDLKGMGDGHDAAMVAGHYIMTVLIVRELQKLGIDCYVGDSERIAEEVPQEDGTVAIVHRFQFAGFRPYPKLC